MTTNHRRSARAFTCEQRPRWLVPLIVVVLLLVAVPVGLRGLGGGGASSASVALQPAHDAAAVGGEAGQLDQPASGAAGSAPARSTGGQPAVKASPDVAPANAPKISRNAWLGLQVTDLTASSARVRSVGSAAGGSVTSENVVTGGSPYSDGGQPQGNRSGPLRSGSARVENSSLGQDQARLTLSVPALKLDGVLAEIARIGTVSYRSSQAEDVTDAYVDAQARVAPARASVARVQALLAGATDLKQVVLIESELSRRQADLDSLTQRLAGLEQRTTMSEVTVTLWTGATPVAVSDNGFVDRLRTALDGLLSSVAVITVGLATLAPWLVVLALLGWVVMRVQRRRQATEATESVKTPPTADPSTPVPAQHTE